MFTQNRKSPPNTEKYEIILWKIFRSSNPMRGVHMQSLGAQNAVSPKLEPKRFCAEHPMTRHTAAKPAGRGPARAII